MEGRIFIGLSFFCLLACTGNVKEKADKEGKIDSLITYYKNGKINKIKFLKNGQHYGTQYWDKNGVLGTYGIGNQRVMLQYYNDTLLFKETFYHVFEKPRSDGAVAQTDSLRIYSHDPHELALKYFIKNKEFYISYYKNNKVVGCDTISGGLKIVKSIINKRLGKDSAAEEYIPDLGW